MKPTLSIAIVGADGSGKTTVIRELLRKKPGLTYLYMGASIDSANYALPTSRWLMRRKRRALNGQLRGSTAVPPAALMPEELKRKLPQGRLFKAAGLVNRLAEEWYRHAVASLFRLRGRSVLCDRHFLFEYGPGSRETPLTERIHHWHLAHLYPPPDLVIFLDAPAEALHRRKPEWPVHHLLRQREAILSQAARVRHFERVDAARPLEAVLADVTRLIAARLPDA